MSANFFIPAPTILFFGVGNSFPAGVDPARDADAAISMRLVTRLTHPDGSTVKTVHLDYGLQTFPGAVERRAFANPFRRRGFGHAN